MTPNASNTAKLIGVGLGPGDPELVTVKAARLLKSATHIAYFAKSGRNSHAKNIASTYLQPNVTELPLSIQLRLKFHSLKQPIRID